MSHAQFAVEDICTYYHGLHCRNTECIQCGIYYRYKAEKDAEYKRNKIKRMEAIKNGRS